MRVTRFVVMLLFASVTVATAHVTVWPRESQTGRSEKYLVRVPTEGTVATTEVELEVPANATVAMLGAPAGWTHEVKREGERIVRVVWKMEIKPGEFAEFPFIARNPKEGTEIVWKVRQRYADGTSSDWIGAPGDRRPAPVTKLTPPTSSRITGGCSDRCPPCPLLSRSSSIDYWVPNNALKGAMLCAAACS